MTRQGDSRDDSSGTIEPFAHLGTPSIWPWRKGLRNLNRGTEQIYDEFLVAAAVTGDEAALARLVGLMHARRKIRALLEGELS